MQRYTLYCTEKQTRKALGLGVPITQSPMIDIIRDEIGKHCFLQGSTVYWFPTAEQMIGWLRSKGFRFKIEELSDTIVAYRATFGCWYKCGQSSNPIGATLAAIDAALDHLVNNRK